MVRPRMTPVHRFPGWAMAMLLAWSLVRLPGWEPLSAQAPSPPAPAIRGAADGRPPAVRPPGNLHRRSPLPNVVILVGEGWTESDLVLRGASPHLERLASEGVRWTSAYAGAPSARVSREALITGRHSGHGRLRGVGTVALANEDVTLAEVLRGAGHRTAAVGVWDLGGNGTPGHPMRQGFSDWFGFLDAREALDLHPKALWRNDEVFDNLIDTRGALANYAPDWFARFATNYIQVHEDHPFFLYVSHPLPGGAPDAAVRSAHLATWDRLVGAVVRELERSRIRRETILVVTGTGAPGTGTSGGSVAPLDEARLRVPLLFSWPGRIPAGRTNDRPVALWDVLPTVSALARVPGPQGLDGVSLAPELLAVDAAAPSTPPSPRAGGLYWETAEVPPRRALRWDHWKVVEATPGGRLGLHDLRSDPGASRDVGPENPGILAEGRRRLLEAADPLPQPRP